MLTEYSKELIKKYLDGDNSAASTLLEENGGLIVTLVNQSIRFLNPSHFDDLCQEAKIGFIQSLKAVDLNKTIKEITFFITGYMKGRLRRYVGKNMGIASITKDGTPLLYRKDVYIDGLTYKDISKTSSSASPESLLEKKELINKIRLARIALYKSSDKINKSIIVEMFNKKNGFTDKDKKEVFNNSMIARKCGLTRQAISHRRKRLVTRISDMVRSSI